MAEKYKPNGTPLTDRERELLVILMEECAEVIQAASKLIRFGKENRPHTIYDDGRPCSNSRFLALELGDLLYMMRQASSAGITALSDEQEGYERKKERLATFLQS